MTNALPADIRLQEMAKTPNWSFDAARNAAFRRFVFADFSEAFAFMTRVAMAAEEACHHPEWTNVFNRVDVWLTTHDAGGVTSRDIALAQRLDAFAAHGHAIATDTDGS